MSLNLVAIFVALLWACLTAAGALGFQARPVPARSVLAGAVAAGAVVAVATIAVAVQRHSAFAAAHLLYVTATLGPALLAVIAAVGMWRGTVARTRASMAVCVLLVVPGIVGLWSTYVAPFQLHFDVATALVPCSRAGDDIVRIGVLADIQTPRITDYERDALRRVMDADPDLILIAGDIQQSSDFDAELPGFQDFLRSASAPHGVFVVQGDVESPADMRALVETTDVVFLENDIVSLTIGDRIVRLGGNQLSWTDAGSVAMFSSIARAPDEAITIVLSHRPDPALDLRGQVDLVVAGHTHGGQVALPFIGPLTVASEIPRKVGAGGLHTVAGQQIYISSGVGMERGDAPQVRFLSPPSVGLVSLKSDGCT